MLYPQLLRAAIASITESDLFGINLQRRGVSVNGFVCIIDSFNFKPVCFVVESAQRSFPGSELVVTSQIQSCLSVSVLLVALSGTTALLIHSLD